MPDDRELFDTLLVHIEGRRAAARGRLDELARRRAAMPARERQLARESLRSQASEIRAELARLRLADSLARALRGHSRERFASRQLRPTDALRQPSRLF